MRKLIYIVVLVILAMCLYITALSFVVGEQRKPAPMSYILEKITSFEYYVDVSRVADEIREVWQPIADDNLDGDVDSDVDEVNEWFAPFVQWFSNTPLYKAFKTIFLCLKLLLYFLGDTILALTYILDIISVIFWGIPC